MRVGPRSLAIVALAAVAAGAGLHAAFSSGHGDRAAGAPEALGAKPADAGETGPGAAEPRWWAGSYDSGEAGDPRARSSDRGGDRAADRALGDRIDEPSSGARPEGREVAQIDLARIEGELRTTQAAVDASRRLAEAFLEERSAPPPARPSAAARAAAAPGVAAAVRASCAAVGDTCLSSSECCSDLVCVGGVGGYGTRGRCEAGR